MEQQQFRQCIAAAVARGQTVFLSSHHLAEVEAGFARRDLRG